MILQERLNTQTEEKKHNMPTLQVDKYFYMSKKPI